MDIHQIASALDRIRDTQLLTAHRQSEILKMLAKFETRQINTERHLSILIRMMSKKQKQQTIINGLLDPEAHPFIKLVIGALIALYLLKGGDPSLLIGL